MNEDRRLTRDGMELIQHFEGCLQPHQGKFKAYRCPAKVLTIGWGTTNEGMNHFNEHTVWTLEQCNSAFMADMGKFEQGVRELVTVALTPWQYDATVSFAYNCGLGALKGSTLLRKINARDFTGAAQEFHKWNKANGKELKGLTRRRASESLMFQGTPDYNFDGVRNDPMPQAVDAPKED